ncbi:MAG: hypothetical protein ABI445_21905, partial [Polyangia bacterium]
MADTLCRISFSEGGFLDGISQGVSVVTGNAPQQSSAVLFAREWSINDDTMNLCDTACVTISNIDGENAGSIKLGQSAHIELSDADVAHGAWCKAFTGIVTDLQTASEASGGSTIVVTMSDVGWFLTQCCAKPLVNIKGKKMIDLLRLLIDPSWPIKKILSDNNVNRRIKHGRTVIVQNAKAILTQVLPYIQVEPGQKPADMILLYAARDGVLVNAGADGSLILFRPDYSQQVLYSAVHTKIASGTD